MKRDMKRARHVNEIDPKAFGKVAVLLGGNSAEREVSLNSGRLVLQGLRDAGIDAHPFDPAERPLSELKDEGFVRAFIALHGGYGENGQLQGALDFYGIRYTGSGVLGSALGMDKLRTKLVWQQTGVPTPPFETVMRGDDYDARSLEIVAKLGLPLFVKPATRRIERRGHQGEERRCIGAGAGRSGEVRQDRDRREEHRRRR